MDKKNWSLELVINFHTDIEFAYYLRKLVVKPIFLLNKEDNAVAPIKIIKNKTKYITHPF